jgi:hypothetical protein
MNLYEKKWCFTRERMAFHSAIQDPHLRMLNPGFNPGFTPQICYIIGEGEPRIKPGVWRPEIGLRTNWGLFSIADIFSTISLC